MGRKSRQLGSWWGSLHWANTNFQSRPAPRDATRLNHSTQTHISNRTTHYNMVTANSY